VRLLQLLRDLNCAHGPRSRHMSSIVLDRRGVRQAQIRGAAAAPANRAADSWKALQAVPVSARRLMKIGWVKALIIGSRAPISKGLGDFRSANRLHDRPRAGNERVVHSVPTRLARAAQSHRDRAHVSILSRRRTCDRLAPHPSRQPRAFRSGATVSSMAPSSGHALPRQASEKRQGTKSRAGRDSVSPLRSMGI
jgi:hypothetical protein